MLVTMYENHPRQELWTSTCHSGVQARDLGLFWDRVKEGRECVVLAEHAEKGLWCDLEQLEAPQGKV